MADNERPLFAGMDELEREVAPQELAPGDPRRTRVDLDDQNSGIPDYEVNEAPQAAPAVGTPTSASIGALDIDPIDEGVLPDNPRSGTSDSLANVPRDVSN